MSIRKRRPWRIETFAIPQVVAAGQVEARETLPSFHYQASAGELGSGAFRCPWHRAEPDSAVGLFARDQGLLAPGRLVSSAKSWLCHSGVDRTAALLPWQAAADVPRLSPVEVSARYLAHLRDAWNARYPRDRLEDQDFVLTLPASFDEVARELTVKAAALAGLRRVLLIEEPQAAFYAWLDAHAADWEQLVSPGQKILVLRHRRRNVRLHADPRPPRRRGQSPIPPRGRGRPPLARRRQPGRGAGAFRRGEARAERETGAEAVGRPGADLPGGQGNPAGPRRARATHGQPAGRARLIGGGLRVEVTRQEVADLLVEGFFPRVRLDEKPSRRQSGFQEFGLPFAARPGGYPIPGRFPHRPSARRPTRRRRREGGQRAGPTSCCSTGACSSRHCCAGECWKCWKAGSIAGS